MNPAHDWWEAEWLWPTLEALTGARSCADVKPFCERKDLPLVRMVCPQTLASNKLGKAPVPCAVSDHPQFFTDTVGRAAVHGLTAGCTLTTGAGRRARKRRHSEPL